MRDGNPHASVNMACWFRQPISEVIGSKVAQLLADSGVRVAQMQCRLRSTVLPSGIRNALDVASRIMKDGALHDAIYRQRLRLVSADGLEEPAYSKVTQLDAGTQFKETL